MSLHSHHIFILPFKWDICLDPAAGQSFSARTNLEQVGKKMNGARCRCAESLVWERFQFDWSRDFNEAVYFHNFVREAIFDNGLPKPGLGLQYRIPGYEQINRRDETGAETTERKSNNLEYRITLNDANACSVYQLEIEEFTLNFYETGVGFLGFHLNNYQHAQEEEILKINDFGRRIYPQFLSRGGDLLSGAKQNFLADKIEIFSGKVLLAGDDFSGLLHNAAQKPEQSGWLVPGFIRELLPAFLHMSKLPAPRGDINISPLLDDRMFLVCWVGNNKWSSDLTLRGSERPYETDTRWHRLIFVDGKWPGMANPALLSRLNREHTNDRWGGYGTFYGVSRYSFVAITDSGDGKKLVLPHIQTMYFQIALLCLLQRGSIVRFSEEIANLAGRDGEAHAEKDVQVLYKKYLDFINKIYFREVTPQEQGIELYKLLQEKMEIERDVKSLESEIQDFFNLLKLQSDERQTEALNTLTIVGSALLVPTLILAYYGLTDFPEFDESKKFWFTFDWTWKITGMGFVVGFFAAWLWVRFCKSQYRFYIGLAAVALVLAVFYAAVVCPKIWF